MNKKIKKILLKNRDFFLWVLVFLSIDYILLFILETTLPGLVIENFNLNILLVVVLMGWSFFLNYYKTEKINLEKFKNIFILFFLLILFLGGWLVLYNIIFWEFLIILGLIFFITFYFLRE